MEGGRKDGQDEVHLYGFLEISKEVSQFSPFKYSYMLKTPQTTLTYSFILYILKIFFLPIPLNSHGYAITFSFLFIFQ
jgi:hypothetical protein